MPRRKYLFGSRQEAEDKVREIDHQAHQQLRLARALYTGGVPWVKNPHRGQYRMGAFDLKPPVARESFCLRPAQARAD